MAYTYNHKGTKWHNNASTWEKIAMWTAGDAVELIGDGNANLPNSMGAAVTLAAFIAAFDGAIAAANGFATLDGTGKLTSTQLPSSVAGGLTYGGAIDASIQTLDDIATLLGGTTGDAGKYVVITTAGTLVDTVTTAKWETNAYDDGEVANSAELEVGDIVLCTQYATDHHVFTILSNTYGDASDTKKGIVQLSDVATRATLAGNHVITEAILATILNDDLLVDGDFPSAGFMKTDGAGGYSVDGSTYLTQTLFDTNNPDLAAIEALAGTAGILRKTAAETFELATDVLVDSDFGSEGFMRRGATVGSYSIDTTVYQPAITVDAGAPSGGVDGDLWIVTS